MEKLQVLFPVGSMRKLREIAKREDRPMSEIVRSATEDWLNSQPAGPVWELGLTHGWAVPGIPAGESPADYLAKARSGPDRPSRSRTP